MIIKLPFLFKEEGFGNSSYYSCSEILATLFWPLPCCQNSLHPTVVLSVLIAPFLQPVFLPICLLGSSISSKLLLQPPTRISSLHSHVSSPLPGTLFRICHPSFVFTSKKVPNSSLKTYSCKRLLSPRPEVSRMTRDSPWPRRSCWQRRQTPIKKEYMVSVAKS